MCVCVFASNVPSRPQAASIPPARCRPWSPCSRRSGSPPRGRPSRPSSAVGWSLWGACQTRGSGTCTGGEWEVVLSIIVTVCSVGAQWTCYNPQSSSNNCWWSPTRQQELTLRHPDPPLLISIFPLKGIKRYVWVGTTSWDGISHLLFSKQEGSEGNLSSVFHYSFVRIWIFWVPVQPCHQKLELQHVKYE